MIKATKDLLASKAAQLLVGKQIARYGKLESLRLDSKKHQMELICHLEGESTPLKLRVEKYILSNDGAVSFLEITETSCSHIWVARLMEDFVHGIKFPIPGWVSAIL